MDRIISLMTEHGLSKSNGFISRLDNAQKDVISHIARIVPNAIDAVDDSGKLVFARVRQKRRNGQYRRLILLESVIRTSKDEIDHSSSFPVGLICCSDLEEGSSESRSDLPEEDETPCHSGSLASMNKPTAKRKAAENWAFEPDETPLPEELTKEIEEVFQKRHKRLYEPTLKKITSFLNHLWNQRGEARLGVRSLAKMGFHDYAARKHLERLARVGIIQIVKDACASEARSNKFLLTKRAMAMFGSKDVQELSA